jgi:hypothetical protein
MVIAIFGSWIAAAILYYVSQKHGSRGMKIALRIIAVLALIWPFLLGIWNNYIAPKFGW